MDDLTVQLTQTLNDPGRMQQIMDMAAALGVTTPDAIPPDLLPTLTHALEEHQALDRKQDALIQALLPYLRPGRQERLAQALRIARLSQLAEMAMKNTKGDSDHV